MQLDNLAKYYSTFDVNYTSCNRPYFLAVTFDKSLREAPKILKYQPHSCACNGSCVISLCGTVHNASQFIADVLVLQFDSVIRRERRRGKCGTGKCGTNDVKFEGRKCSTGVLENAGPKMQEWKMQDRKMRD